MSASGQKRTSRALAIYVRSRWFHFEPSGVRVGSVAKSYFKRRLQRAFADTIGPLGWNRQTVPVVVEIPAVFLLVHWFRQGWGEAMNELEVFVSLLIATAAVFSGNFIWNYVAAPSRMQAEADEEIDGLQGQIDRIRNKQNAVDELSSFLSEGINTIWNAPVTNDGELEALDAHWKDWHGLVVAYLTEHFNKADVDHFNRLGVIPVTMRGNTYSGTDGSDDRHTTILMHYALQEQRLREIIRDHNVTHV